MKSNRNDPCPCGSGKKYKKCCLGQEFFPAQNDSNHWIKMRQTEGRLMEKFIPLATKFYGTEAVELAILEFFTWPEEELDLQEKRLVMENAFLPWFLFNWDPDPFEKRLEKFEPISFAEHYLKKHPHSLSADEKAFILSNLTTYFSVYQVQQVERDVSITLFDLLRGITVTIHERQATHHLQVGSLMMARVLTMEGDSIAFGTYPMSLPPSARLEFEEFRRHYKRNKFFKNEDLFDRDIEIRGLFIGLVDSLLKNPFPKIRNSDNEDLVMNKVFFDLKITVQEAFEALYDLALPQTKAELLAEAVLDSKQQMTSIRFPWLKIKDKKRPNPQVSVFADITLTPGQLMIEANSNERAAEVQKVIKQRLSGKAVYRDTLRESIQEVMKNAPKQAHKKLGPDINDLPEIQAKLKELNDAHWQEWLDMKIPALNDKTPRAAAKTKVGRERLEALFADFHSHNQSGKGQFPIDLNFLRKELGMD